MRLPLGRGTSATAEGTDAPQVVARLDAGSAAAEGEEVELCLDIDRIHLFDAETGANIQNPTGDTGEVPRVDGVSPG